MPSRLEKRLNNCDSKLDALFQGVELNAEIERQLKKLKEYYCKRYMDGDDDESTIKMYELFVTSLEQIKKGQLSAEEALKEIDEISALQKTGIVLENILKALELLFWATAASVFFSTCVLITPPIIAANPLLALATLTTACTWAMISLVNFFDCIDEFKSFSSIDEECKREKNLISFFKPAESTSKSTSKVSGNNDTDKPTEKLYPDLSGFTV